MLIITDGNAHNLHDRQADDFDESVVRGVVAGRLVPRSRAAAVAGNVQKQYGVHFQVFYPLSQVLAVALQHDVVRQAFPLAVQQLDSASDAVEQFVVHSRTELFRVSL